MNWAIEYKCRRCGQVVRSVIGAEVNCEQAVREALFANHAPFTSGLPVGLYHTHTCPDGGCGVMDLIGCGEVK